MVLNVKKFHKFKFSVIIFFSLLIFPLPFVDLAPSRMSGTSLVIPLGTILFNLLREPVIGVQSVFHLRSEALVQPSEL